MEFGSSRVGPPVGDLVETEVDGQISLYDAATARVHILNGTASDTWLLSDGEHTAEQIVGLLADAYGLDADEIRTNVLHTVDQFRDQGLLCPEDERA